MKGYIILAATIDETTCEDDGFLNCMNFSLASNKVYKTKEEVLAARDKIMRVDFDETKEIWQDEVYDEETDNTHEVYAFDIGSLDKTDPMADTYIDVYFNGSVTNETIYKIQEVEF